MVMLSLLGAFIVCAQEVADRPLNFDSQTGGVYTWKSDVFRYPNGDTWPAYNSRTVIRVTSSGQCLLEVPGVGSPYAGEMSGKILRARTPLFGTDFTQAPPSIQAQISDQRLERSVIATFENNYRFLSGTTSQHYVTWKGTELDIVDEMRNAFSASLQVFKFGKLNIQYAGFEDMLLAAKTARVSARRALDDRIADQLGLKARFQGAASVAEQTAQNLSTARENHKKLMRDWLATPENLKTPELRNLLTAVDKADQRIGVIEERVKLIRETMPNTPPEVIARLIKERSTLQRQNTERQAKIAALETRLGIVAHRNRAKSLAENANALVWDAEKRLARAKSERDLVGRLAEAANADVVAAREAFAAADKRLTGYEGTPIPVINGLTIGVPELGFRARTRGSEELLRTLDQMIIEQRQRTRDLEQRRKARRAEFDEQKPLVLAAGSNLANGQWYSACSQAGIEFVVQSYEVIDAFKSGGLVGVGVEAAKKFGEACIGGIDYIVEARVVPPAGDLTCLELTFGKTASGAGKQIVADSAMNLWQAPADVLTGMGTTGFQTTKLLEAEKAFKDTMLKIITQEEDKFLNAFANRTRSMIQNLESGTAVLAKLRTEAKSSFDKIGDIDRSLKNFTYGNGCKGLAVELGKSFAKGLAMDLGKAAAKQAVADYFEGTAWTTFTEANLKMKARAVALGATSSAYWEAKDELENLTQLRRGLAREFDPHSGMAIDVDRQFYMVSPLKFTLEVASSSTFDPTRVLIDVEIGGAKCEPEPGQPLVFKLPMKKQSVAKLPENLDIKIAVKPR